MQLLSLQPLELVSSEEWKIYNLLQVQFVVKTRLEDAQFPMFFDGLGCEVMWTWAA